MASSFNCAILPLKMYGEKKYLFQFLSTVHAKVAIFNPTNYTFLRSATLSIEHIKSFIFQKFKNLAGMPTCGIYIDTNVRYTSYTEAARSITI